MNWKKYQSLNLNEKLDETYYIIGLDLGNDSSGMAFYNLTTSTPEVIDLSGGYGKPSIPTVIQYIAETKEWVFGEYAVLNQAAGAEVTLSALLERLGNFDYIDIDRRSLSVASILSLFIKEILGNVRNINPKAEIVGIVTTVPAYFSNQAYEELYRAFNLAGYEKELIALVPDRECVLAHHCVNTNMSEEHIMLLDFGSRELRGGLYHIANNDSGVLITSISSLFNKDISIAKLNNDVSDFFEGFVLREIGKGKPLNPDTMRQIHEHIAVFSYQHRDMLFQRNIRTKPIKLYFNFTYPPFQQTITHEQVQKLLRPYASRFDRFMQDVFKKSLSNTTITPEDIDTVLCIGGGFEMLWAKEAVSKHFSNAQVNFFKNPKMVTCEGAAIVAARTLGIPQAGAKLQIEDTHQLAYDIGLTDGKNFFPLVERNAFWWQSHSTKLVLVNQEVNGELNLNLCTRTGTGELHGLANVRLNGLPLRPKGTTRLEVGLSFLSNTEFSLKIRDRGFGEMFPKSEYERDVQICLI